NIEHKSDLDLYLSLPPDDTHTLHDLDCQYDGLGWWKSNGHKYPVLCEMVRDIFGVPISTIPSESAFSTGGQVLDLSRSSLTPGIVEALICSRDWLRSNNATVMSEEEDLEELAELENGNCSFRFIVYLCS
ncbi:Putative AC9 transposase, partial [Linum perenne]